MICYKDMCFCQFYTDCIYKLSCRRSLTPEIIKDAEKFGLPIDRYAERPECWIEDKL